MILISFVKSRFHVVITFVRAFRSSFLFVFFNEICLLCLRPFIEFYICLRSSQNVLPNSSGRVIFPSLTFHLSISLPFTLISPPLLLIRKLPLQICQHHISRHLDVKKSLQFKLFGVFLCLKIDSLFNFRVAEIVNPFLRIS